MRFFILLALLGACYALPHQQKSVWEDFKLTHKKTYTDGGEESLRMRIFLDNLDVITKHNELYQKGEKTFEMGTNQFSDLLMSEYNQMKGFGIKGQEHKKPKQAQRTFADVTTTPIPIPDRLDWRYYNTVTPIKNQGQCGSCWAFSSTGALEGMHARYTGKLVELSEQNLVDCTNNKKYNNGGCNGGWMENAWKYVNDNDGIDNEATYPYTAQDGTCSYDPAGNTATCRGYVDLPSGDEGALLEASGTIGPISIAIDATQPSFMNYRQGVYVDDNCGNDPDSLDHAVLVIGYDHDAATGLDYWLVKNSWDTTWGDQGFIKMARNRDNQCGVATHAAYPTA